MVAVAASLTARPRREAAPLWFGVFCLLYGVRLAARSSLIAGVTPWPPAAFEYAAAFVTYTILVPAGLLVESLVGEGRHRLVRRAWQFACVYGVTAVVNDLARQQPEASMWLNPPAVLLTLAVVVPHIASRARGRHWPPEARAVAFTLLLLTLVTTYETISEPGLVGPYFDAEPFVMLLFTGALGWFVLSQTRNQASAYAALSRELQLAREIQQSLLPRRMPQLRGLRISGAYLPMSAVAGDFYDVMARPDGSVVVIVADVSGHGVPAALIASMVKVAFAVEAERYDRPGDILGGINRALTGAFERAYVTACCAVVDSARRTIAYAAAGHPPPLLLRRGGGVERLAEAGVALALLPVASGYGTADVSFAPGDRLLIYTDGLLEAARAGTDEFFGDAELERLLAAMPASEDVLQSVLQAHRQWMGGAPLSDDVTLLAVDCVE